MELEFKSETTTTVTPEILAKCFWSMSDYEQAAFFKALASEVKNTEDSYSYGEIQWCYMVKAIRKDKEASRMYMALSAWAYDWVRPKADHTFLEGL